MQAAYSRRKLAELLSIAFDVSYTHTYAPGTRRHIKAALKLGATMEEIMEVLKLCVIQGVQARNLGVPTLAQEVAARSGGDAKR
jgi:alkylhydroperoxidase/carboxymuconolactone decarboxylase family protein YurZ